ncbi:hypothetical protein BG58_11040 [Caballeronia jiangsuensis]|nr:hypothetical protein BG58_11040 [Caballeronia jiangsuensis]
MFNFDMEMCHNCAVFHDDSSDAMVIVISYDNKEFEVQYGTFDHSELLATLTPINDDDLNSWLDSMFNPFDEADLKLIEERLKELHLAVSVDIDDL